MKLTRVDEEPYLLHDPESETKFKFDLKESIVKAQQKRPYENLRIYTTPSVKPDPEDLAQILQAAHAIPENHIPDGNVDSLNSIVIVGDLADSEMCQDLAGRGYAIQSKEFILTGLLRQQVDYKR